MFWTSLVRNPNFKSFPKSKFHKLLCKRFFCNEILRVRSQSVGNTLKYFTLSTICRSLRTSISRSFYIHNAALSLPFSHLEVDKRLSSHIRTRNAGRRCSISSGLFPTSEHLSSLARLQSFSQALDSAQSKHMLYTDTSLVRHNDTSPWNFVQYFNGVTFLCKIF